MLFTYYLDPEQGASVEPTSADVTIQVEATAKSTRRSEAKFDMPLDEPPDESTATTQRLFSGLFGR